MNRQSQWLFEAPATAESGNQNLILAAQKCQQLEQRAKSYQDILDALKCELQIPFTNPNDPGLYRRRLRLRSLFKATPPKHAKMLYNQLQQKGDSLARLFRYRLSTVTHHELLKILQLKFATKQSPSAPSQPTSAPPPWFKKCRVEKGFKVCPKPCVSSFSTPDGQCDLVDSPSPDSCRYVCIMTGEPWQPPPRISSLSSKPEIVQDLLIRGAQLPSYLEPDLKQAVQTFKQLLTQGQYSSIIPQIRKEYILCILNKLIQPYVDDRYIVWGAICTRLPGFSPNIHDPSTGCETKIEADLFRYIKTKRDIWMNANDNVRIFSYWKVVILDDYFSLKSKGGGNDEKQMLWMLDRQYLQFIQTTGALNSMYERLQSTMPPHYVAIKDWIAECQGNPNSVYFCR